MGLPSIANTTLSSELSLYIVDGRRTLSNILLCPAQKIPLRTIYANFAHTKKCTSICTRNKPSIWPPTAWITTKKYREKSWHVRKPETIGDPLELKNVATATNMLLWSFIPTSLIYTLQRDSHRRELTYEIASYIVDSIVESTKKLKNDKL